MDYVTARSKTVLTSVSTFMGDSVKTYHYDTQTGYNIDVVFGQKHISIFVWDRGNLIDSDHAPTWSNLCKIFTQFVTLYGIPLFD